MRASVKGPLVAFSNKDQDKVFLQNVETGQVDVTLGGHKGRVIHVISLDNGQYVTNCADGNIRIFKADGVCDHVLSVCDDASAGAADGAADGAAASATASSDGDSGKKAGSGPKSAWASYLAPLPGGRIAYGSAVGPIVVLDPSAGAAVATMVAPSLTGRPQLIRELLALGDGRLLAIDVIGRTTIWSSSPSGDAWSLDDSFNIQNTPISVTASTDGNVLYFSRKTARPVIYVRHANGKFAFTGKMPMYWTIGSRVEPLEDSSFAVSANMPRSGLGFSVAFGKFPPHMFTAPPPAAPRASGDAVATKSGVSAAAAGAVSHT